MTKISQLSDIGANLAANDEFVIRDVSDGATPNKKVTSSGFIDYVISQGAVSGFTQIAAGAGPLARVRAFSSGSTGTVFCETAESGSIAEAYRVTSDKYFRMAASTGGIQFNGDNAAANALDDYEEGTFTFGLYTSGGTLIAEESAYSTTGRYSKIGNLVHVYFSGRMNVLSTTAGPYYIPMPFAMSGYGTGNQAFASLGKLISMYAQRGFADDAYWISINDVSSGRYKLGSVNTPTENCPTFTSTGDFDIHLEFSYRIN